MHVALVNDGPVTLVIEKQAAASATASTSTKDAAPAAVDQATTKDAVGATSVSTTN